MGERFIDPTIYSKAETKYEGIPAKMKDDIKEKETEDEDAYESAVTAQYFENWEEIELEGNHGIKEKIRENIIRAEKENQKIYETCACNEGISVEEFKTRLQKKVEDMIEQAEFFIAVSPDLLKQIALVDGRWKSQLETERTLGASLDPSLRATMEREMFGFNEAESLERLTDEEVIAKNKEKRPIYGYFSDDEHGGINFSNGKIPPPTNVQNYGRVNVRIKKERALQKATITFYDSFSRGNKWPPLLL